MSIPLISIYFFNVVNYSSLLACKMFYFIFVVNYKVVDLLVFFQIPQELAQSNICAKSYGKKKYRDCLKYFLLGFFPNLP